MDKTAIGSPAYLADLATERALKAEEELQFSRNAEALQAAKLAKLHTEITELKAKLEDAEVEIARLSDVALDGYHVLERERANSARIKQESDAVREENQGLRARLSFDQDLAKRTQNEVIRLRTIARYHLAHPESVDALKALREAVE